MTKRDISMEILSGIQEIKRNQEKLRTHEAKANAGILPLRRRLSRLDAHVAEATQALATRTRNE